LEPLVKLSSTTVSGFKGIDLRLTAEGVAPNVQRIANNVDLTTGGGLKVRDQLKRIADVTGTIGLYSMGGKLRCATPRITTPLVPPPGFKYDVFSDATGNDSGGATEVTGVQQWNGNAYLAIKRGTVYEHHYVTPTSTTTKVSLPFLPGPYIFSMVRKIWGHDRLTNDVWFSSSINGPTNWTESGDAGYIKVAQHAPGDSTIRGFTIYGSNLCVFFKDSVQIWTVSTDPADNELRDVIGGAGTVNTRSIVNMMGDPIYFAEGGFRNLSVTAVTGQAADGDIGAAIFPETRLLDLDGITPVAVWAASRAQYLCAVGNVIYVYTNSPVSQMTGWTKYTVPGTVSDLIEHNGEVYVRIGNNVYKFDADYEGESGFSWSVEFPFNSAGNEYSNGIGVRKQWVALEASMSGTTTTSFRYHARTPSIIANGPVLTGSSYGVNHIPIGLISESIAMVFGGTTSWTLDHFTLRFAKGNP
jgi:hypothetical protein